MPFLVATAVTCATVALLLPLLERKQVIDVPNARSSHSLPVPRGGGLAVAVGVFAAVCAQALSGASIPWPALALTVAMTFVGFMDDLSQLSSRIRFAAQIAGGAALAAWLLQVSPRAGWPTLAFGLITVVGFSAFVNAYNFMDGINGISALTGIVAGGWFVWVGHDSGLPALIVLGASTAGACLGFLPWNAPRARVFLGDAGSYALGTVIVSAALYAWANGAGILTSSAPLLVYLADTAWTLVQRARRGAALGTAHREHVYQRLVDRGWSHVGTATVVAFAAVAICGFASLPDADVVRWTGASMVLAVYLGVGVLMSRGSGAVASR